jgi:uncharacterized protein (TIGR03435 family)
VVISPTLVEPGVFGILRPVLLLPEGIANRLTHAQLRAILAHEMCHVRRRDNLAAALHMVVEALFWFHPLVWWIGARLIEERERACDEEVLRLGAEPLAYAEGILNVCKFYLESPLPCAAGVTGADLKKRIEDIMSNCLSRRLTPAKKILLAAAALIAVAGPVVMGVVKAQSLVFAVASIRPSAPGQTGIRIGYLPGGGLRTNNTSLRQLINYAYDLQSFQLSGGPSWLDSERYEVTAKPDQPEGPEDLSKITDAERKTLDERIRERLRNLLAERFQLVLRTQAKEMPVYALVVAKGGPKLQPAAGPGPSLSSNRGMITGQGTTIPMLIRILSARLGRIVVDQTGLTDKYDFTLEWSPDPIPQGPGGSAGKPEETLPAADPAGPSLATALQQQLGLKLEATKGSVEVYVVERAEKASAN